MVASIKIICGDYPGNIIQADSSSINPPRTDRSAPIECGGIFSSVSVVFSDTFAKEKNHASYMDLT